MRKLYSLFLIALVAGATMYSCSLMENQLPDYDPNDGTEHTAGFGPYFFTLQQVDQNSNGTYTWRYQVTKNPAFKKIQDVSHISLINFACNTSGTAATLANVVSTEWSFNNWATVAGSRDANIALDPSQNCYGGDVVKIDAGGTDFWFAVTMDDEYTRDETMSFLYKSGKGTGCGTVTGFFGPSCLVERNPCEGPGETSYAGTIQDPNKGSWYGILDIADGTYDIHAGKHVFVGTATLVGNNVTINLAAGNGLGAGDNVYVYTSSSDPGSRPTPGHQLKYNGTSGATTHSFDIDIPAGHTKLILKVNVAICSDEETES
jgi:hypothetical protein